MRGPRATSRSGDRAAHVFQAVLPIRGPWCFQVSLRVQLVHFLKQPTEEVSLAASLLGFWEGTWNSVEMT